MFATKHYVGTRAPGKIISGLGEGGRGSIYSRRDRGQKSQYECLLFWVVDSFFVCAKMFRSKHFAKFQCKNKGIKIGQI